MKARAGKKPVYRLSLKAKISLAGYQKIQDLAEKINVRPAQISRVLGGWEFPSSAFQKKLADALQISVSELARLL